MIKKIALAGNPNSGKTTLFNALTGANQSVGNWPGVTVEKKEGVLRGKKDVRIIDLPGIYSLSPYSPEERVARNYLRDETPDAIINIIDGSNLERNLYLTTQLTELSIPVVAAVNMIDVVKKRGESIDCAKLSKKLGIPVVEISALKGTGLDALVKEAYVAAEEKTVPVVKRIFQGSVEKALAEIELAFADTLPADRIRWYSIKPVSYTHLKRVDDAILKAFNSDITILAIGGVPVVPSIKNIDDKKVVLAEDVLKGEIETAKDVVIIGGGLVGIELAIFLGFYRKEVTIVEMLPDIAHEATSAIREQTEKYFEKYHIRVMCNTKVVAVEKDGVFVEDICHNKANSKIICGTVCLAAGYKKNTLLYNSLNGIYQNVLLVGDAESPSNALSAIKNGYEIGVSL